MTNEAFKATRQLSITEHAMYVKLAPRETLAFADKYSSPHYCWCKPTNRISVINVQSALALWHSISLSQNPCSNLQKPLVEIIRNYDTQPYVPYTVRKTSRKHLGTKCIRRNMRSTCQWSCVLQFTWRRAVCCGLHRPMSQVILCLGLRIIWVIFTHTPISDIQLDTTTCVHEEAIYLGEILYKTNHNVEKIASTHGNSST